MAAPPWHPSATVFPAPPATGPRTPPGLCQRPRLQAVPSAVTAKTNRSKGDKDPDQWLPPAQGARCIYAADWTATKLRWKLSADQNERGALLELAKDCPDTTVEFEEAGQ